MRLLHTDMIAVLSWNEITTAKIAADKGMLGRPLTDHTTQSLVARQLLASTNMAMSWYS